jgi:hypothetical protein
MIVVQMAEHDSLDVLDGARTGGLDRRGQVVDALDPCSRGALADHRVPMREVILAAADVKEDEADVGVVNQARNHDGVATLMLEGAIAGLGGVGADVEVIGLAVDAAQIEELFKLVNGDLDPCILIYPIQLR